MAAGDVEARYQPIPSEEEEEDLDNQEYLDTDEAPAPFGPEGSTSKWSHQRDLDKFFIRVYQYHQRSGFLCIAVEEVSQLIHFAFMVFVIVLLDTGINYNALFGRTTNNASNYHKVTLSEVFIPVSQWSLPVWLIFVVVFSVCFILYRAVKFIVNMWSFNDIRSFYQSALNISSSDLTNMTWHEVQRRLMQVQEEQHICVQKKQLSELDIYHRILRTQNYMVALVNKEVLPLRFNIPLVGQYAYLSSLLRNVIEYLIFYWPLGGAFENSHLAPDYKRSGKRKQLADALSKRFLYVGLALLFAFPLLWLFQVGYFCCRYAELIRRKPGELGIRKWSNYARLVLRHFNELDHELSARLNRAHRPATRYMSIFISPLTTNVAKSVGFLAGTVCFIIIALGFIDEDVFQVEHMLQALTVSGVVMTATFALLPEPYTVYIPEEMLRLAVTHMQHCPDQWLGKAHTEQVRSEFAVLFQYRLVYFVEEVLSPIITPLILLFRVRQRSPEIVDFLRNFTVDVTSVGDVCSFAQMDLRKFGNPAEWDDTQEVVSPPKKHQTNHLKTEFSLIHFHKTNPEWKPTEPLSVNFLNNIDQREREMMVAPQISPYMRNSLAMSMGLPSMPSLQQPAESLLSACPGSLTQGPVLAPITQPQLFGGLSSLPGPASLSSRPDMAGSYVTSSGFTIPRTPQELEAGVVDLISSDMAFSTNYLLTLRHRRTRPGFMDDIRARTLWGHSEASAHQPPSGISEVSLPSMPGFDTPSVSVDPSTLSAGQAAWTSDDQPYSMAAGQQPPYPSQEPYRQVPYPQEEPFYDAGADSGTQVDPPSSPRNV